MNVAWAPFFGDHLPARHHRRAGLGPGLLVEVVAAGPGGYGGNAAASCLTRAGISVSVTQA